MQLLANIAPGLTRRRFLQAAAAAGAVQFTSRWQALQAADQPAGSTDLIVRSADPRNAEPPLAALLAASITPVDHFYVRTHGPTPKIDASGHTLRIEGLVHQPQTLKLAEVAERFKQHSAEATLTCAGNRRAENSAIKTVGGVQWDAGAIGNARWTGPTLADLLRSAEIKEGAKHVWFEGADSIPEKDGTSAPFGGSIPLDKALGEPVDRTKADRTKAEAHLPLVAHAMNDQPLTTDHGFPLRTVVPGYIGARSVKWLTKITVSDRPSPNHFLAAAYKLVQSDSPAEAAAAQPIYAFPVNAAICTPAAGAQLPAGRTLVSGYALPAGEAGCTIAKVEISPDGGKSWTTARLLGEGAPLTWRLWAALIDLSPGRRELIVRATDSQGHAMPAKGAWNAKGYLYNGWHHVAVDVV